MIPDADTLAAAWKRAHAAIRVNELIRSTWPGAEPVEQSTVSGDVPPMPADIAERIRAAFEDDPSQSWDEALWTMAAAREDDRDEEEGARGDADRRP